MDQQQRQNDTLKEEQNLILAVVLVLRRRRQDDRYRARIRAAFVKHGSSRVFDKANMKRQSVFSDYHFISIAMTNSYHIRFRTH